MSTRGTWLTRGMWTFASRQRSRYEVDAQLWFEFDGNGDLDRRAELCEQAAAELKRFSQVMRRARNRGRRIDWAGLARVQPSAGAEWKAVLLANGISADRRLLLLARLQGADWRRVVEWLQDGGMSGSAILRIERADRLTGHRSSAGGG